MIKNYREVEPEEVEGAPGVTIRWLISEKDEAPNFAMRLFEIKPGCATPYHTHDWEHEIFILEGKGAARTKEGEAPLKKDDAIFVPCNIEHQIINKGNAVLRLICLVPIKH